jgi:hypothetical protein
VARLLRGSGAALALFGGVAFASAPTLANDFFEEGDFGGTYSYIGPGVAALPDMDVDVGPLGSGVIDYSTPVATWAPAYPKALEVVTPATDIDVAPAAVGAEAGQ